MDLGQLLVIAVAVLVVNAMILFGVIKMAVASAIRQTLTMLAEELPANVDGAEEEPSGKLQASFATIVAKVRS